MQTLKIRRATHDDLSVIHEINSDAAFIQWSLEKLNDCLSNNIVWLAIVDSSIVAFTIFNTVLDESELLNVVVHGDSQNNGIAKALLEANFSQMQSEGVSHFFLEVGVSNSHAIKLYEKLGFKEQGIRKNYYSHDDRKEDALVMTLSLANK